MGRSQKGKSVGRGMVIGKWRIGKNSVGGYCFLFPKSEANPPFLFLFHYTPEMANFSFPRGG